MNQKSNKDKVFQIRVKESLKDSLQKLPTPYIRMELERIVSKFNVTQKSVGKFLIDEKDKKKIIEDLLNV